MQYPGAESSSEEFYKTLLEYIDYLPEKEKIELLYTSIANEDNERIVSKILKIISDLKLLDFARVRDVLTNDTFKIRKRGLCAATYDKLFYDRNDKNDLLQLVELIEQTFPERGTRKTQKQLLSKEKEVWICECGKTADLGEYCFNCGKDIYGFKSDEVKPIHVQTDIKEKIELLSEFGV